MILNDTDCNHIIYLIKNGQKLLIGRQLTGWTNKLIWGDNQLILSSLAKSMIGKKGVKE